MKRTWQFLAQSTAQNTVISMYGTTEFVSLSFREKSKLQL